MGKGAGKGKGKGKGTSSGGCCNGTCGVVVSSIVLVIVFLISLALLIGGIGALRRVADRDKNIEIVDNAVKEWTDANAANGLTQFSKMNATVIVSPGSGSGSVVVGGQPCTATTLKLSSASCNLDVYTDEGGRFNSVQQLKLCARMDYATFQICNMQVEFKVTQPGSTISSSLAILPDVVLDGPSRVDIRMSDIGGSDACSNGRCSGREFDDCRRECSSRFGGDFTCPSSEYTCSANAWVNDLAVKVSYAPLGSGMAYKLDSTSPALNQDGFGGYVLRKGFGFTTPNPQTSPSPRWQYESLMYKAAPVSIALTIRSSGDPWLRYMSVTDSTGWFGVEQRTVKIVGGVLVAVGCVGLVVSLLLGFLCAWGRQLTPKTASPPPGCAGTAWRMAAGCCGSSAQHAAATTATAMVLDPNQYANQYNQQQPYYQQQPGAQMMYAYPQPPTGEATGVPAGTYYAPPPAGAYPPPQAGAYPPPQAGAYPPPQAGAYPPPQAGAYPPPEAGAYPPPQAGAYPVAAYGAAGDYPPPGANAPPPPPQPQAGAYPAVTPDYPPPPPAKA